MTDNTIESHLLAAGYTPGAPVTADVLGRLVDSIGRDVMGEIEQVLKHYTQRHPGQAGDMAQLVAANAAGNCRRAVAAVFEG